MTKAELATSVRTLQQGELIKVFFKPTYYHLPGMRVAPRVGTFEKATPTHIVYRSECGQLIENHHFRIEKIEVMAEPSDKHQSAAA